MANEPYYFSHDENARNDPKILQMRSIYGWEGYGLYWAFVEKMRSQPDYRIPIGGKYAIAGYSQEFGVPIEKLSSYVNDCITGFNLFQSDGEYVWSNSLLRRMARVEQVSESRRNAAMTRWKKMQEEENEEEPDTQPDEPEEKKKLYGQFNNVALTQQEHDKLAERFGEIGAIDRIDELSVALKSRRGYAQKYKSHYATILAWARRDSKEGNNGVHSGDIDGNNNGHSTTGKKVTNPQNTGRDRTSQIAASFGKYGIS